MAVLERIKKLMNKAESAVEIGSAEEAAAFMDKVRSLLDKNNLSMEDIENVSLEDVKLGETGMRIPFGDTEYEGDWEVGLLDAIARYYDSQVVYRRRGRVVTNKKGRQRYAGAAAIVGSESDIIAVEFVYGYVSELARKWSREKYATELRSIKSKLTATADSEHIAAMRLVAAVSVNDIEMGMKLSEFRDQLVSTKEVVGVWTATIKHPDRLGLIAYREVWIRSYLKGVAGSIGSFVKEEIDKRMAAGTGVAGLVHLKSHGIEKLVEELYAPKKDKRAAHPSEVDAYKRGVRDADGISLSRGVEGATESSPLGGAIVRKGLNG